MTALVIVIMLITISSKANAQLKLKEVFNKAKNKARQDVDEAVNKEISKVLEPKKKPDQPVEANHPSKDVSGNGRPAGSDLNDEDFVQNAVNRKKDPNYSRLKIAKNLMVDVKGIYPTGYQPKWRFITYNSDLDMDVENWIVPGSGLQHNSKSIAIGDYNGRAVLRFGAFITCDCYADIVIKDSFAVLTETPQTFKVTNFQKIVNEKATGEKCRGIGNVYTDGGWEGKITLSANENGDILMSLMVENYSTETKTNFYDPVTKGYPEKINPSSVSYRYLANNINIANEMSAEKANAIIAAEKETKQRQKDYEVKTKKQLDSIMKVIARKYPQIECRECFYSSSGGYINSTNVDEYYVYSGRYSGSHTEYDLNIKTVIQNKCNYDLTFVGIQQMHNDEQGYYLQEVTKSMPMHYNYSSDQGIMASAFTSILGMGSEFNIKVQDKYYISYASVGAVQWLKVIKSK